MLLPRSSDATFEDAYGEMGPDLEARSLGWALLFGMMLLSIGLDTQPSSGHPTYAPIGRSTLMRVAERHAESPKGPEGHSRPVPGEHHGAGGDGYAGCACHRTVRYLPPLSPRSCARRGPRPSHHARTMEAPRRDNPRPV